jgi:hypothetical protein
MVMRSNFRRERALAFICPSKLRISGLSTSLVRNYMYIKQMLIRVLRKCFQKMSWSCKSHGFRGVA